MSQQSIRFALQFAMPTPQPLRALCEKRGYAVPTKAKPYATKEIAGGTISVLRDDEHQRVVISWQGASDWSVWRHVVDTVYDDLEAVGLLQSLHGQRIAANLPMSDEVMFEELEDCGYESVQSDRLGALKSMGDGLSEVGMIINADQTEVAASWDGPIPDASCARFALDNLSRDLATIGLIQPLVNA